MLTLKLIKKVQKYCHKLDCFTYIHITSWLKIEFHDIWSESTVNKIKIKKSKNPDKIFWGYLLRIKQENTGKDVSFIKIFAIKGTYMSVIRFYSSASLSTVLVNDSFIKSDYYLTTQYTLTSTFRTYQKFNQCCQIHVLWVYFMQHAVFRANIFKIFLK